MWFSLNSGYHTGVLLSLGILVLVQVLILINLEPISDSVLIKRSNDNKKVIIDVLLTINIVYYR